MAMRPLSPAPPLPATALRLGEGETVVECPGDVAGEMASASLTVGPGSPASARRIDAPYRSIRGTYRSLLGVSSASGNTSPGVVGRSALLPIGTMSVRGLDRITSSRHEAHNCGRRNRVTPLACEPGSGMSVFVDGGRRAVPPKRVPVSPGHPGILQFQSDMEFGEMVCINYHRARDAS